METKHGKDMKMVGKSLHRLINSKWFLINLIAFYEKIIESAENWKSGVHYLPWL